MPLRLANLDDLTWEALVAEARSLIPARSSQWTDHNPSDPGITLIELFAYFTEGLIYELNRVSRNNVLAFLRLINGPDWKPGQPLAAEKRAAVLQMREPHRAVTAQDFETLALGVNKGLVRPGQQRVARARCIFGRNLESPDPKARNNEAHAHVSVVIVPADSTRTNATPAHSDHTHAEKELLRKVKDALEPARLITTRLHVVPPRFVTVTVRIELTALKRVDPQLLRDAAIFKLRTFFDRLQGGFDGTGWPFGRSVYVSELYQLLTHIPGVDYVSRSKDPKSGEERDELSVPPGEEKRLRRNRQQELEAIHLLADELVSAQIDSGSITVVPA